MDAFHGSFLTKIGPEIPKTHLQWREFRAVTPSSGGTFPRHTRGLRAHETAEPERRGPEGGGGGRRATTPPPHAPKRRPACPRRPLPSRLAGARAASRRGRRRPGLSDPAAGLPAARGGRVQRLRVGLGPWPGSQQREPPELGCAEAAARR